MRHSDGGVEQPQVVVNFGDGPDGRSRAAAGGLLLDGDRRAQAVDAVHIGPLHLVKELAGVGGKRLDVTALAFGVDGVEGERRLARAAEAGDHGQRVARNLDVNVFQIVLARPAHRDAGQSHGWISNATLLPRVILSEERSDESKDPYNRAKSPCNIGVLRLRFVRERSNLRSG